MDISCPEYKLAMKMGQWPMSHSFACKNQDQDFDGPFEILMGHSEKMMGPRNLNIYLTAKWTPDFNSLFIMKSELLYLSYFFHKMVRAHPRNIPGQLELFENISFIWDIELLKLVQENPHFNADIPIIIFFVHVYGFCIMTVCALFLAINILIC